MEVVGLVFATVEILDLILERGSRLAQRIDAHKKLKFLISEVRFISIDSARSQFREQLLVGQSICKATSNAELKAHLNENFETMQRTIFEIEGTLDILENTDAVVSFFTFRKHTRTLEGQVKKLSSLKTDFNDHIIIAQAKRILPSPQLLTGDDFQVIEELQTLIPQARLARCELVTKVGRVPAQRGTFLIDKSYTHGKDDVTKLAEHMASANASPGFLDFVGFREIEKPPKTEPGCYELIFAVPEGATLHCSLRKALQDDDASGGAARLSLTTRIALCAQLASGVLHVHNQLGMVHKNINAGNVIIANVAADTGTLRAANAAVFLTDWRYARYDSSATNEPRSRTWSSWLYQHPTRQLQLGDQRYNMGHDIYSLGVCMLEILLWRPLVITAADGQAQPAPLLKEILVANGNATPAQPGTDEADDLKALVSVLADLDPKAVKAAMIKAAEDRLPGAAGDIMSGVVVKCLKCLDADSTPVSFTSGDDTTKGMNFVALVKADVEAARI